MWTTRHTRVLRLVSESHHRHAAAGVGFEEGPQNLVVCGAKANGIDAQRAEAGLKLTAPDRRGCGRRGAGTGPPPGPEPMVALLCTVEIPRRGGVTTSLGLHPDAHVDGAGPGTHRIVHRNPRIRCRLIETNHLSCTDPNPSIVHFPRNGGCHPEWRPDRCGERPAVSTARTPSCSRMSVAPPTHRLADMFRGAPSVRAGSAMISR